LKLRLSRRQEAALEAEIMTIRDVANYLHCHTSTLYRLVRTGEIPSFKLGGSWRLSRSQIDTWIARVTARPL